MPELPDVTVDASEEVALVGAELRRSGHARPREARRRVDRPELREGDVGHPLADALDRLGDGAIRGGSLRTRIEQREGLIEAPRPNEVVDLRPHRSDRFDTLRPNRDAVTIPQRSPSSSSRVFGQLFFRRRESERSARSLPPVWQRAQ